MVPALRMPEREAFIANCLADATASSASSKSNERAISLDFGKPRALAPLRIVGASLGTTARSE